MIAGWKTVVFNVATAILGVLTITDWTSVIGDQKIAGYVILGMSMANMVLRAVTTTPIGSSTPKP
jgi:hypothetical protein